jgi:glycine cleavage system H protein
MVAMMFGWDNAVLIFVAGIIVRALALAAIVAIIALPAVVVIVGWDVVAWALDAITGVRHIGRLRWRSDCYYTPDHLWLRPRAAGAVRVGVDGVAERLLPEVRSVSLAAPGTALHRNDPLGAVHCADGTVILRAPFDGTVTSVNAKLLRWPTLLHRDPYRLAWLADVQPVADGYESLPTDRRAEAWLAGEDRRLTASFERELGMMAADGGDLVEPAQRLLTHQQWDALRGEFMSAA